MHSLNRAQGRQQGLRKRRRRRGKRTAQIVVATAIVATALLIPFVTGITSGDASTSSGASSTASSSATSGDSASGMVGGGSASDGGSSSGSSDGSGSSSASGASVAGGSGAAGDGSGNSPAGTTGGDGSGGSNTGVAPSSTGSLDGFVLIFSEEPPDTSPPITGDGSGEPQVPGSAFDDFPPGDLTTIEEDWELTITEPDALLSAPQIGTVMTPFEDADTLYLAFAMNHRVNTTFRPGGMELQLWYQEQLLGWNTFGSELMVTPNETITWTQRLEIQGSKLRFSIVNGKSATWGNFGQGESMHLDIATTLTDLNDYHPNVSAKNSGVSFAANRVGTLVLKKVRGYDKQGELLVEDKDPLVVFGPDPQP